jgi:hypothetical protein
MFGKELIVVTSLLLMTALPAVIGLKSTLLPDIPQIRYHLLILIIVYLILFHIGSIISYEVYSRYRRPHFLWNIYNKIKAKTREKEIHETLRLGVIKNYQEKLIDLSFDDINSNEYARKEVGLISIREMYLDPKISFELKRKIINSLISSIEHESIVSFKNILIRELSKLINNLEEEELRNLY